ncbi:MAG: TonB-dependent receptor, partial [Pseudomonadota bacterium]
MRSINLLLCGAAAAALSAPVAAQAQAQTAEAGAAAEMDEIVVSLPARDERSLHETPAAVSVVDEAEATRRQASTFEELIGDVPGLSIDGGPRGIAQEPNIRGFQDEQVVIRLDGARQNFNTAHRGRFFVDPDIVKQVEVVRSGSSALFGSGAIGGVIGVETKSAFDLLEPDESYGARFKTTYESNGQEIFGSATFFGAYGKFDALGFISYREPSENLEDGGGAFILDSEIDARDIVGKLGFQATDDLRLEFSANVYDDDGQTPNAADGETGFTTLVDRDIAVRSYRLKLDYAPEDSNLTDLDAIFYFNSNDLEENRINVDAFDTTDLETFGLDVTNRSKFTLGLPVAVAYGVEAYRDELTGERQLDGFEFPDDSDLTFVGVFAQADIELTDTLTLTPGGRFDHFGISSTGAEDRSESQFSPRVALTYTPDAQHTFWANWSQSFRAPSLTELFQDGVHFSVPLSPPLFGASSGVNQFVPTPDLDPEQSNQFEIGMRARRADAFQEGDRITFEANAYYARVDDFVDTVVVVGPQFGMFGPVFASPGVLAFGTTTNVNVDAELFGLEGAVNYDAGFWYLGISGALARGRNLDGGGLGSTPQDRGTLAFGVRPALGLEL